MIQNDMLDGTKLEGLTEGRAEGREEGRVEGERNKQLEIARNSKQASLPVEVIIQITSLSSEEIKKL